MKKTLLIALMAVCALFYSSSVMAEEIIWQEDWSSVTEFKINPENFNPNYTFTGTVLNDDGSFKSGTTFYEEALAGGEAPELLIAKNGGSFAAKVALNGVSGQATLAFKCNKTLAVTVSGATIGDMTKVGNDYTYPVTIAAGTSEITITFTMSGSSNARIDNIKLFMGEGKKPAGLSWGKASAIVTLGSTENLPVLQNSNNLPVKFSSSATDVATIAQDGTITLVAVGKTKLTAAFEGNDEYEAESVSIEMTVKDGQGGDQPDDNAKGQVNNPYTVAEALEVIAGLGTDTSSPVYAKGIVTEIVTPFDPEYGNVTFMMSDDASASNKLEVFRCKSLEGKDFTSADQLVVGDEVVIYGKLVNYKGNTPEFTSGCYLHSTTNPLVNPSNISEAETETQQGAVYNLAGQRLKAPKKGVNITAGKKYMVK